MKPLVYVAAPYSSHPTHNTRNAILTGLTLWRTGLVAVIIPHLTLLADAIKPMDCDDWYEFDLDQVEHCDAVLRLPGDSVGADAEVAHASERGILIFYSVAEILEWATRLRNRRETGRFDGRKLG